jgi:hypothetical protein
LDLKYLIFNIKQKTNFFLCHIFDFVLRQILQGVSRAHELLGLDVVNPRDGGVSGQKLSQLFLPFRRVGLTKKLALLALANVPVEHEIGEILKVTFKIVKSKLSICYILIA